MIIVNFFSRFRRRTSADSSLFLENESGMHRLCFGNGSARLVQFVTTLCLMLFISYSNAWGSTETFDFSSGSYNSTDKIITWTGTSCTIVQSKGGSNTAVNSDYTGTNLRWYASHDITFTPAANITITSIVLVGKKDGKNSYYGQTMTEQSSTSATITNTSTTTTTVTGNWTSSSALKLRMGSQFRLTSVTITYCKNPTATSNGTFLLTINICMRQLRFLRLSFFLSAVIYNISTGSSRDHLPRNIQYRTFLFGPSLPFQSILVRITFASCTSVYHA